MKATFIKIIISFLLIVCLVGLYTLGKEGFIFVKKLKRTTSLNKHIEGIKIGDTMDKVIEKLGNEGYVLNIHFQGNRKLLYYPTITSTSVDIEELKRMHNSEIALRDLEAYYAFYFFSFNDENQLEAFALQGESLSVQSDHGNIKGSSPKVYYEVLRNSAFTSIDFINSKEEQIVDYFGDPQGVEKVVNFGEILFYGPISWNEASKILNRQSMLACRGKLPANFDINSFYYAFLVNKQGKIEAKEDRGNGTFASIYGKIRIKDIVKQKIWEKNDSN